jgi:cystathionine beta-lyase/cystathionine gamma-synthase
VSNQLETIAKHEQTIADLKKAMGVLTVQFKEQTAQIQKVSDQLAAASPSRGGLETSKATPNVVFNNP